MNVLACAELYRRVKDAVDKLLDSLAFNAKNGKKVAEVNGVKIECDGSVCVFRLPSPVVGFDAVRYDCRLGKFELSSSKNGLNIEVLPRVDPISLVEFVEAMGKVVRIDEGLVELCRS